MSKTWKHHWHDGVETDMQMYMKRFCFSYMMLGSDPPFRLEGKKVTDVIELRLDVNGFEHETGFCLYIDKRRNRIVLFDITVFGELQEDIETWVEVEYMPDKKTSYPDHWITEKQRQFYLRHFHEILALMMNRMTRALTTVSGALYDNLPSKTA